jgi:hypothetical protein
MQHTWPAPKTQEVANVTVHDVVTGTDGAYLTVQVRVG